MFIVSGDSDIEQSAAVLENEGWIVLRGDDVGDVTEVIAANERVIVVAHGDVEGSVYMCSSGGSPRCWMSPTDRIENCGCRIYVYCCHAGGGLMEKFFEEELFGHVDVVPMPLGGQGEDEATRFLDLVWHTIHEDEFNRTQWQKKFMSFLDARFSELEELPAGESNGLDGFLAIYLLRKSLKFGDLV